MAASEANGLKEGARRGWGGIAPAWRLWHRQHAVLTRPATEAIVAATEVGPGSQVLDLACGAGDPAFSLAAAVSPDGTVTATDLVPEMLEGAGKEARERGLANLEFRVADAEALPFPDESFDAVTCRFGLMFFPDPGRALAKARRVLRPEGRIALVAWGSPEQPYFSAFDGTIARLMGWPPPVAGTPGLFAYALRGRLGADLAAAGFTDVREAALEVSLVWPGPPEEYLASRLAFAPQLEGAIRGRPDGGKPVFAELRAAAARYASSEGVTFPGEVVVASGRR